MKNNYLKFTDEPNHLERGIQSIRRAHVIPNNITPDIAVDVGANVGQFALAYHNIFKRIICIEPSKESVDKIIENVKNAKLTNVEAYRYGVSDVSGKILKLYNHKTSNNSANATTATALLANKAYDGENYEEVDSISLEDIFIKFNIDKINYFAIDCEYSEIPFLLNKDLSNIDYLGIEHHGFDSKETQELLKYLLNFFVLTNKVTDAEYFYTNKRMLH